jgi:predicted unusual protein kinase regulating ubiquinone biosynthesis (AarF/ABC1/UbiB family)
MQILANIGEDLLVASADKPFRFPAEFTFVVRSFSVLDGIGKSLTPRFDISEISAPYARELILDGGSAVSKLQEKFQKGLKRQNKAVKGLFNGPLTIEEIRDSVRRCVLLLIHWERWNQAAVECAWRVLHTSGGALLGETQ